MNKNLIVTILISILISSSIFLSGYLIYERHASEIKQYEITEGIAQTFGAWSIGIGALMALFHIPSSFKYYIISFFAVPIPMIIAIFYEITKYPTSHNLFPFELISLFIGSVIIHLPSIILNVIYQKLKKQKHNENAARDASHP